MKKRKTSGTTEIAYQNKDITSKVLAEEFKGKDLKVYGLELPGIKKAEPTNFASIEANELRIDNLFTLEDDSAAIIDYESEYREENKSKYLGYATRASKRIFREQGYYPKIRIIIIYTADVDRGTTNPTLDMGDLKMSLTEAFLSDFDPKKLKDRLQEEIVQDREITDELLMKLIVCPLTYKDKDDKTKAVGEAIDIAEGIQDRKKQVFALTAIYTFADKVIRKEDAERIRRLLNMTQVEQIYTKEREKAVRKAERRAERKAKKEKQEIAIRILKTGDPIDKAADCTGLTLEEVSALAEKI